MADRPINLNHFRKTKARADKRAAADANAVKFGRTKAEKTKDAAEQARTNRELDGHRLVRSGPDEPDT